MHTGPGPFEPSGSRHSKPAEPLSLFVGLGQRAVVPQWFAPDPSSRRRQSRRQANRRPRGDPFGPQVARSGDASPAPIHAPVETTGRGSEPCLRRRHRERATRVRDREPRLRLRYHEAVWALTLVCARLAPYVDPPPWPSGLRQRTSNPFYAGSNPAGGACQFSARLGAAD